MAESQHPATVPLEMIKIDVKSTGHIFVTIIIINRLVYSFYTAPAIYLHAPAREKNVRL